ncbi:MAG: LLM class flavin-dependent oxidoreductase [Myxococcota bacterium]
MHRETSSNLEERQGHDPEQGTGPLRGAADGCGGAGRRSRWGLDTLSLGISLGGPMRSLDWLRQLDWIDHAEALGLHSVWLPEMHFARGASSSPLVGLAGFAARTRRLRLGTTSLLLPIHDPRRVAADVDTLQSLSGGRLLLGLGRGFRKPLFQAFGIDAASKRDRFDAALDELLETWGDRCPPLAVAAFGRKGLEQAARRGLPYLASPLEPLDLVAENLDFHREHLPGDIDAAELAVPILRTIYVAGSDAEAREVREALDAESRIQLRGRVPAALDRAADAPAEARTLVGCVSEVIDQVARYRERLGMDLLIARVEVPGATLAERRNSLARLAEEVIPALAR